MAENTPQTLANHPRYDPPYHFFVLPVFATTLLLAVWGLVQGRSFDKIWTLILAIAWVVAGLKIRTYALGVQDRLIRLEERLRLSSVLPEPLRSRVNDLTTSQMVALRFASDAELPALVEKTLAGNLPNAEIKKAIVNWRPDYQRI